MDSHLYKSIDLLWCFGSRMPQRIGLQKGKMQAPKKNWALFRFTCCLPGGTGILGQIHLFTEVCRPNPPKTLDADSPRIQAAWGCFFPWEFQRWILWDKISMDLCIFCCWSWGWTLIAWWYHVFQSDQRCTRDVGIHGIKLYQVISIYTCFSTNLGFPWKNQYK